MTTKTKAELLVEKEVNVRVLVGMKTKPRVRKNLEAYIQSLNAQIAALEVEEASK